jgi:hypothetical protein
LQACVNIPWPSNRKTFDELEVTAGDDLFQRSLALEQGDFPQVAAVEVEQVEGDE